MVKLRLLMQSWRKRIAEMRMAKERKRKRKRKRMRRSLSLK